MTSIQKRPNGKWRARYHDPTGKERSKHFDRKTDAQRFLDETTTSLVTGQYVDPKAGRITFEAYSEQWLNTRVLRLNTLKAMRSALTVHAYPTFGSTPIASVRPSLLQAFVKDLSASLSPRTVRVTMQHVRAVFESARQDKLIAANPCDRLALPRITLEQIVPMTTEQVLAVRNHMPADMRAFVTLAAGTGLRPGETAGLTVDRLDFLRMTLRVDRQLMQTYPPTFGPPKTASSVRTIPMPRSVVEELAAHLAEFPAGEEGLVFHRRGLPRNRDWISKTWRRAAEEAAIPDARLHGLRHYYASLLIRHGESVKVVQARLGHSSARETLDTYSHLWPDSDSTTRAAVDDVLGVALLADSSRTANTGEG